MNKNLKAAEGKTTINCQVCNVFVSGDSALVKEKGNGYKVVGHAGVDKKEVINTISDALKGKPGMEKYINIIIDKIEAGGYMNVDGIVRRWIPSQCLAMLYGHKTFHQMLQCRGYDYMWKVVIRDLKQQMKLYREKDMEGYADRNRWYNLTVVLDMVNDYLGELKKKIESMRVRKCKGREYIDLRVRGLNGQKGIFVDELNSFIEKYRACGKMIANADSPEKLYAYTKCFFQMIKKFSNWEPKDQSKSFINAYKAAGAYYTARDLILFEGCHFQKMSSLGYLIEGTSLSTEDSLDALDNYFSELVERGVASFGYEALGMLKSFLDSNSFDYKAVRESWAKQTEARRASKR